MFQRILVATHDSDLSNKAVDAEWRQHEHVGASRPLQGHSGADSGNHETLKRGYSADPRSPRSKLATGAPGSARPRLSGPSGRAGWWVPGTCLPRQPRIACRRNESPNPPTTSKSAFTADCVR